MIATIPASQLKVGDVFSTDGFTVESTATLYDGRVSVVLHSDDHAGVTKQAVLEPDFPCHLWRDEPDDEPDEPDTPDDDDGFIGETDRGYAVSLAGKHIGTFSRARRAEACLYLELERAQYWPNLWRVNERGNMEQFAFDSHLARDTGNGLV